MCEELNSVEYRKAVDNAMLNGDEEAAQEALDLYQQAVRRSGLSGAEQDSRIHRAQYYFKKAQAEARSGGYEVNCLEPKV